MQRAEEEMAGALAIVSTEHREEKPASAIGGAQWEIQYSRFINYFSGSSSTPNLTPLPKQTINRHGGAWLSSSSSAAVLELFNDQSTSEEILVVSVGGKIQEEHFLHKLQFSWPQVSCVSGFPPGGSRVVFVSYRDCGYQIQKFALRFSTSSQTQIFIDVLKGIMNDEKVVGLPSSELGSEISAQSQFAPSCRTPCRAREESILLDPADTRTSDMPPSVDYKPLCMDYKGKHNLVSAESVLPTLPPSFTSLLTNCGSVDEQAKPTLSARIDLKAEVMKYMDDSSFQDMLNKVEQVIGEMGYDTIL